MPQKITVERYKAFDGKVFDTRKEAEAHESENYLPMIAEAKIEEIMAAVEGDERVKYLTAAIERAALEIKRIRRARAEASPEPPPSPEA